MVLAQDPETGETGYKEVADTFVKEKDTLVHVKVDGTEIKTTKEHPFWVEGEGFVEAKDLQPGDTLRLADGKNAAVEKVWVEVLDEAVAVYNFEVADYHTYFVSEMEVLVHNRCGGSGKAFINGKAGEAELAKLFGGKSQAYFKTSRGKRYIDQLADGIAHESKVGYTTLNKRIKEQILKDAELIRKGKINGAHWHFFTSQVTGKGSASKPLLNSLHKNGIKYTIH